MSAQQITSVFASLVHKLSIDPERPVVHWQDEWISGVQLLHKSIRLSQKLQSCGLRKGQVVGVYIERCPDVLVILLAIWRCEAVYLPLDLSYPHARVAQIIEQANIVCIITQPKFSALINSHACPSLCINPIKFTADDNALSHTVAFQEANNFTEVIPAAESTAYLLFTSGSSGRPKGVKISHQNLLTLFNGILPVLQLKAGWQILGCANFSFDIAFFELLAPILTQTKLVLVEQEACKDPEHLVAVIQTMAIELVQATPSLWHLLLASSKRSHLNLKMAISTGEALDSNTATNISQHTESLWNLYGPTECTIWSSAHQVISADLAAQHTYVPIGKALSGYELSLVNEEGLEVKNKGELYITGNALSAGYCESRDNLLEGFTQDATKPRIYKTGDLCSRDENGNYHFIERIDNQIKVNGYRIETDEISLLLKQHSSINNAACIARTNNKGRGSQIIAFIVFNHGMPNKDKVSLNNYLAKHLPDWMLPDKYLLLDKLPINANGKLDKDALLKAYNSTATAAQKVEDIDAGSADLNPIESTLSKIFCEVLELKNIGIYDNFFDAGGNSMLGAVLIMSVNDHFHSKLTMQQALDVPPTVNSIYKLLLTTAKLNPRLGTQNTAE